LKHVQLITDGACKGNPGKGGWACILRFGEFKREIFGCSPFTTNNRMELAGAIEGLKRLKEACSVEIVTDSEYLRNGMTSWINGWKRNGWMTKTKKPVTNKDLWMILDELVNAHKISWTWTKGHANHEDNNRCDELASHAAERQLKSEPDPKGDIYRKHAD
jgi:ribonuclease HI